MCVFVLFSQIYAVTEAIEIPAAAVKKSSTKVQWVNGWRVGAWAKLSEIRGAKNLTGEFQEALRDMDARTANGQVLEIATVERRPRL
jgi:hypothetical protein